MAKTTHEPSFINLLNTKTLSNPVLSDQPELETSSLPYLTEKEVDNA